MTATSALALAADADHLTSVLRTAGMLGDACVRDVELENPRDTILSHVVRLKLTYDGVASNAPPSLFLKTARSDRLNPSWVAGRQEVAFYTQVAPDMPAGLAPRCFDADWNAETNEWHLLLEDLTATHARSWSILLVSPTSLAIVFRLNDANSTIGRSMPHRCSGNAISRIATSRSFTAM